LEVPDVQTMTTASQMLSQHPHHQHHHQPHHVAAEPKGHPSTPASLAITPGAWQLDPTLCFLNHGSYGAVLRPVTLAQQAYRDRMERDPVRFFKVDLEPLMDGVRTSLAGFLNCRPLDIAPVSNATIAISTILANANLQPGDEVLITDHEYQSLSNELERVCARTGARVVRAVIPFPIADQAIVAERFLGAVTPRTRLAFISHITSATSLIFPVAPVLAELNRRGIDTVLDGAHSVGQLPLDLTALAPAYFVGSGHKWLSAPKGTGFLVVRPDRQGAFRTLALSSRAAKIRPDRALFLRDFDYMGTADYTPILAMSNAVAEMGGLLPGGWPALMRKNHDLIMKGRAIVCDALGIDEPCPERMVGSMCTLPLPEPSPELANRPTEYDDALQDALYHNHRIVTPVWRFGTNPATAQRVLRVSAQLYNRVEQYEQLAQALRIELARERGTIRASA
jgi:isopenicillin-N epimerase